MPYVSNEEFRDLLEARVKFWKEEQEIIDLYMKMYDNMLNEGCFEDNDKSIMEIVDNDVVNWCSIVWKDDADFEKLLKAYKENEHEVDYYYIEAVDNEEEPTIFLCRNC